MFKIRIVVSLWFFFAASSLISRGQSFQLSRDSAFVRVNGSSTLHDWKMDLKEFDCMAGFVMDGMHIKSLEKVEFKCKATDLKSESSLMDKKAYSALKTNVFPDIIFRMTSLTGVTSGNRKFSGSIKGDLSIAGKTNTVSIPLSGTLSGMNGINKIDIYGEVRLKMSDFDISAPVLMMGALKTGDEITVSFSLQFFEKS
ncbi:MAG: YceI family protein [Bacteroidales bacterium]|jgi:hypothetical protein